MLLNGTSLNKMLLNTNINKNYCGELKNSASEMHSIMFYVCYLRHIKLSRN